MPVSNCLVIMRSDNMILSRIVKSEYSLSKSKTQIHFLSIEYTHPKMENKIPIYLDSGSYLEGNEILSNGFIRRCLEYQSAPFVFDDDYKLDIMDSKIKMLSLKSDQHVVLGKTNYAIEKI